MTHLERLGGLVEETIRHIRSEGLDPTDALLKVAESHKLTDSDLNFVAGQVNTARHLVHMARSQGAERLADFPLADAAKVKAALKRGTAVPRDAAPAAPAVDGLVRKEGCRDRVKRAASAEPAPAGDPLPGGSLLEQAVGRFRAAVEGRDLTRAAEASLAKTASSLASALQREADIIDRSLLGDLEGIGRALRRRASADRVAFARRVVGRYGAEGAPMVACVWHFAGADEPIPNQGSGATVFPAEPLYLKAASAVESARRRAALRSDIELLRRVAAAPGEGDFADTALTDLAGGAALFSAPAGIGVPIAMAASGRQQANREHYGASSLSMETTAKLHKLRVREAFMRAVIEDPTLRGYPLRRLVSAFNDTVQNQPEVVRNPPMIRAGMRQALSSPGPDIFTLKAMTDATSAREKTRRATLQDAERMRDKWKERDQASADAFAGLKKTEGEAIKAQRDADLARWKNVGGRMLGNAADLASRAKGAAVDGFKGTIEAFRAFDDAVERRQSISEYIKGLDEPNRARVREAAGVRTDGQLLEKLDRLATKGERVTGTIGGKALGRATRASQEMAAAHADQAKAAETAARERAEASARMDQGLVRMADLDLYAGALPAKERNRIAKAQGFSGWDDLTGALVAAEASGENIYEKSPHSGQILSPLGRAVDEVRRRVGEQETAASRSEDERLAAEVAAVDADRRMSANKAVFDSLPAGEQAAALAAGGYRDWQELENAHRLAAVTGTNLSEKSTLLGEYTSPVARALAAIQSKAKTTARSDAERAKAAERAVSPVSGVSPAAFQEAAAMLAKHNPDMDLAAAASELRRADLTPDQRKAVEAQAAEARDRAATLARVSAGLERWAQDPASRMRPADRAEATDILAKALSGGKLDPAEADLFRSVLGTVAASVVEGAVERLRPATIQAARTESGTTAPLLQQFGAKYGLNSPDDLRRSAVLAQMPAEYLQADRRIGAEADRIGNLLADPNTPPELAAAAERYMDRAGSIVDKALKDNPIIGTPIQ